MKWYRKDLKNNAGYALQASYGTGIAVIALSSLIIYYCRWMLASIVSFGVGLGGFSLLQSLVTELNLYWHGGGEEQLLTFFSKWLLEAWPAILVFYVLAVILQALLYVFIKPLFQVGRCRWFSRNRELAVPAPFALCFSLFATGNYWATVRRSLAKNIRLLLWALPLLFLPLLPLGLTLRSLPSLGLNFLESLQKGLRPDFSSFLSEFNPLLVLYVVILALLAYLCYFLWLLNRVYSYYMVDWLIADNPQLQTRQVLALSRQLMLGQKWKLFLLNLSFLPWYILSLFSFVLMPLVLWSIEVKRYQCVAEFYAMVRDHAVQEGQVTMENLGYKTETKA